MKKEELRALIAEKKNEGLKVVVDPFQTEMLRDKIMTKIGRSFEITSLTFKDDGSVLAGLISVAPSRQYSDLIIEEDAVVLTTEGWARRVKRYCDQLLNVEVEGEISAAVLDHMIYKISTGIDTRFVTEKEETFVVTDPSTGNEREEKISRYYDIFTREEVGQLELIDKRTNEYLPNVIVYNVPFIGGQTCTNGQMKKGDITLVAANRTGFNPVASWNRVTYGASEILTDEETEVTPKDIAQANARLSAYKAPSVPFMRVDCAAFLMGKLTYGMIKGGNEYKDGFGFVASEPFCEGLNNAFADEYFFVPSAADGLGVQVRPWTCKLMAEIVQRKYITEMISHWGFSVCVLERGHISQEDKEEFYKTIKSKGKSGKFAGKVVVICNDRTKCYLYDFFTDLNGLKAPFDPDLESWLEMLDMTHTEHKVEKGANTSSQLIQSLMVADPEATFSLLENLAARYLSDKKNKLMTDKGVPLTWTEKNDPYMTVQQVLGRVFPKFVREYYAPIWHTIVDKTVEGYVTRINRLNLPTYGAYTKVVSDSAADFGVKILDIVEEDGEKFVEVVAPVATSHGYDKAAGIKYPKQGIAEYLKCKVISKKEYCDRVKNNTVLTDVQKDVLISHVRNLSGGLLMIPAIETLKNLLAGMDFDGDGIILFFERDLLDILFQIEPKAVVIDDQDITVHDVYEEVLGDGVA